MITAAQVTQTQIHICLDFEHDPTFLPVTPQQIADTARPFLANVTQTPEHSPVPAHRTMHFDDASSLIVVQDGPESLRIAQGDHICTPDDWSEESPAWLFVGDQPQGEAIRNAVSELLQFKTQPRNNLADALSAFRLT